MAQKVACVFLAGVWCWVFAVVWSDPGTQQFDFKTYYVAAHTYEMGENPYDIHTLRAVARKPHLLGFYYPLSALHLLRPVASLDYATAHRLWVLMKAFALVALLWIWKRWFLDGIGWPVVLVVALLAFNAATAWDIKTGNITVFEQLFLWAGFASFIRRRMTLFTACIVAASIAKLMPVLFLILLLLPAARSRGSVILFVVGVLAVAALTLAPFATRPEYFAPFVRGLTNQHPPFQVNPSALGLADEVALRVGALSGGWARWAMVAIWYGLLLAASVRLLRRTWRQTSLDVIVLVAALAYAVFAPRLIIYSYMIAIVPALALILPAMKQRAAGTIAVVVALCIGGLSVLPSVPGEIIGKAAPLILLLVCWISLIVLEKSDSLVEPS